MKLYQRISKQFSILIILFLVLLSGCINKPKEKVVKKYELVFIQEKSQTLSIIDNETGEEQLTDSTLYSNYVGLFSNDSICIRDLNDNFQILYTVKLKSHELTISAFENERISDSLIYYFNKEKSQLSVNSNIYNLTPQYFDYLFFEGYNKQNIYLLLSLFISEIEDFSTFNMLIDKTWFPQIIHPDHKIINAQVYTKSSHSDMVYQWNVLYNYNDLGYLDSVKKVGLEDDSPYFESKLITTNDSIQIYKKFRIDDGDRFSENTTSYLNYLNCTDSVYTERQQEGYTITNIHQTLNRLVYQINGITLNSSQIHNIIEKDFCR